MQLEGHRANQEVAHQLLKEKVEIQKQTARQAWEARQSRAGCWADPTSVLEFWCFREPDPPRLSTNNRRRRLQLAAALGSPLEHFGAGSIVLDLAFSGFLLTFPSRWGRHHQRLAALTVAFFLVTMSHPPFIFMQQPHSLTTPTPPILAPALHHSDIQTTVLCYTLSDCLPTYAPVSSTH